MSPHSQRLAPVFAWPVRVYWEDTDAGGVVYHANYLRYLERARSEWLRALGFGQERLRTELNRVFVVHSVEMRFLKPARLDDMLAATVSPHNVRSASFSVGHTLRRDSDGQLLVEATVRVACLSADTWRPHPIPDFLLSEIATDE